MQNGILVAIGLLITAFIAKIAFNLGYAGTVGNEDNSVLNISIEKVMTRAAIGTIVIALIAGVLGAYFKNPSGELIDHSRFATVFIFLGAPFLWGCWSRYSSIKDGTIQRSYNDMLILKNHRKSER